MNVMTKDEAKKHFGMTVCPNKCYEFVILKRLIHVQFADDVWSKLDSELHLNKSFVHFGTVETVETVDGKKLSRIILGKFSITWGKML